MSLTGALKLTKATRLHVLLKQTTADMACIIHGSNRYTAPCKHLYLVLAALAG